jgi:hypothetical protein
MHGVSQTASEGIQLISPDAGAALQARQDMRDLLQTHQLDGVVETALATQGKAHACAHGLPPDLLQAWAPEHNTLALHKRLPRTQGCQALALAREILVAMLVSPHGFQFPSVAALASHLRVRQHIAMAAQKTALAFKTEAAERPACYWRDGGEEHGFILQPGRCLVDALIAATQPDATGKLYDFSCYRATEYVILLGIAQELKTHHPALLTDLQQLNETHAVRSGQFHEVYLIEYGSMANPLPAHYCVPGDRLWFRNPDERSSDVMGYEGSWVIYMGGGLFSNFWERDRPYTLESKAIEIYHWRDGAHTNAQGLWQMDENVVEQHVRRTCADPEAKARVLQRMLRPRDPQGVYAQGGCIDSTREHPRGVSPQHCQLVLPSYAALT